mgnify:CR=1 FL=1
MLLDVAGITGVFYFTGGATNPFVWFYLLPLMIAATILPRIHTWIMAAVTVICYTSLFLIDAPVESEHAHHDHASGFQMHVFGMWLGFVMSAGFVAVIIVGMAHTLRQRDRRLAEAEYLAGDTDFADRVRERIRAKLCEALDRDGRVLLVSHGLGCIVAYDVLWELSHDAELAPRYAERNGGYTRILKMGPRQGDNAQMARIELV